METRSQAKAKLKRQHENDDNEQREIQRLAASPAEPEHTTKITDLNDDCLMKVFGYLDLQSLFNVAVANAFLRPAARDVYKRKFGTKKVVLFLLKPLNVTQSGYIPGTEYTTLTDLSEDILCAGLKTCLQYLRCFGPLINNLAVDYQVSEIKHFNPMHQYVNDYCGENLVRIEFIAMPNMTTEEFQKVFTSVEEVEMNGCHLEQQWPSFAKCFPNLRYLQIEDVEADCCLIEKPFQFLEEMFVYNLKCNGLTTNRIIADLLNGANRLKCLRIIRADGHAPIDELLTMIKDCSSITSFDYSVGELFGLVPVNSTEIQRIVTEYPALIELRLEDYRFSCDDVIALIRQLNSLKEFKFQMEKSECDELMPRLDDDDKWNVIEIDDEMGFEDNHTLVTLNGKM